MSRKTLKMQAIRDEVLNLPSSELVSFRKENNSFPVIGEGSHDAQIMFIGEAPGKNEAKTGRPFCGASGKILDELLDSGQSSPEWLVHAAKLPTDELIEIRIRSAKKVFFELPRARSAELQVARGRGLYRVKVGVGLGLHHG